MNQPAWKEHTLPIPDGQLAWFTAGHGPTVLFLAGGPGDDHTYLRSLAEPLTTHFHCVLLDQRGTGRSLLHHMDETTLHIHQFLDDLETLRVTLGEPRLRLVGHSWGATLALLYSVTHPEHVERAALIGLGPLNDELSQVASANLLKPLSATEREESASLATQRKAAIAANDLQTYKELHIRLVTTLLAHSWIYSPEAAARFAVFYPDHYAYNPLVAKYLLPTLHQVPLWERLPLVTAPMLIMYGYQDFEPITQAYLLQAQMPQAHICLINECGHIPWFDQPERCLQALETFLNHAPTFNNNPSS